MNVGALRHLVTLQNPSQAVADGDGSYTQEPWVALDPPEMWADIQPATARDLERRAAGTVISSATHIVTMRYRPDITTQTRMIFRDRVFSITGVSNPEERGRELVLVCVEVVE